MNIALEVEHIIPISRGGPDEIGNLALACNLAKPIFSLG
jgi:5-methylcytosine-specific restriction endonuclease McrA